MEDRAAAEARAKGVVEEARMIFGVRAPYWGDAINRLVLHWAPGLGTAAITERGHLMLDPLTMEEWREKWGAECIAGILAHELCHVVFAHFARRGDRNPRAWNIAGDLYINSLLRGAGWTIPPIGVFPENFTDANGAKFAEGLSAERYYELLDGSKNEQGEDGAEKGNGQSGPTTGDCGSGAGGEPQDGEPTEAAGGPESADDGSEGRTPDEMRELAERAARALQDAIEKGQAGKLGGELARWAGAALEAPSVSWQQYLRIYGSQAMQGSGRGRRTYRRPHRRQACLGAHPRNPILPSRQATTCSAWCAVDTSASMSQADLAACVSELAEIMRLRRGKVSVLACDAKVQGEPQEIARIEDLYPLLTGGGGTNFDPIFSRLAEEAQPPELLVIATDGYGPCTAREPKATTVIWLITAGGRAPVSWGTAIELPEKK